MKEVYVVITPRDKGGCHIESLTKEALLSRLNEEYYGNTEWCDAIPDSDPNYWGNVGVIIKSNQFILPRAVQVTTQYEL